jgi:hypothetical protein
MSFEEALERVSRDDSFRATVYAMNTLLIQKGIYTQQEFRTLFVEWVEKENKKKHASDGSVERSKAASA